MTKSYGLDRPLRVFACAAAHGSFTAAAKSLGTSQPAVSHAVQRLEAELGHLLLERKRTGVVPTERGAQLLAAIEPAYSAVDRAIAATRLVGEDPVVSISVSTSLATWWLLPRLPDFKQAHEGVELRIVTTDSDHHVDLDALDLWIPLGPLQRPDLVQTQMCEETLVPVGAPDVAAAFASPDPADLAHAPLLHLEERYRPRFDWHAWFASQHADVPAKLSGDRSTDYSLVLHAALAGQGVALGWLHLVEDMIDDGRLVAMGPPTTTDQPFVVAHQAGRPLRPGAAAFRDWIVAQMSNRNAG